LPFGERFRREFAACPSCNSLERTRLMWFYLINEAKVETLPLKILHFAPEKFIEKKLKKLPNIQYISADINPAFADVKVDITSIPFNNNTFDIIICSHVLGHVEDESKALQELYRTLQPNACALIMTNIFDIPETIEDPTAITYEQKLKAYGQNDLARMHGHDFTQRLQKIGFKVETTDYINNFSIVERQKYGLTRNETIYMAIK
jgi:SAM-dependent methyltransferase